MINIEDVMQMLDGFQKGQAIQQKQLEMQRVLVILTANIKGNEIQIRSNNPELAIKSFELLKKEGKKRLSEGHIRDD